MFRVPIALSWPRPSGRRKPKPARYRPVVQSLEARCLLSTFQELPLPPTPREPPTDEFHRERITTGLDGNLWFTESLRDDGAAVGRIAPDGTVAEFPLEDTGPFNDRSFTQVYNITAGPDGNLWLLAVRTYPSYPPGPDGLVVIQVTPDGNHTVFEALPNPFVSSLSPLALGSDGNLWYAASFYAGVGEPIVGRITPTGAVTNFNVGSSTGEFGVGGGITAGPDGNLWVGAFNSVRPITPDGQALDPFPGSHPLSDMLTDASGNVWGLLRPGPAGSQIERIAPDGTVSDFPLPVREPTPNPEPELDPCRMTITAGPDGNIWFSDPYANQIGSITPDGTVTEYAVPTPDSFPAGITAGPEGNLWFTELGSGQIGEFVLNGAGGGGGTHGRVSPAGPAPVTPAVGVDLVSARAALPPPSLALGTPPPKVTGTADASSNFPRAVSPPVQQPATATGTLLHDPPQASAQTLDSGLADPLGEIL